MSRDVWTIGFRCCKLLGMNTNETPEQRVADIQELFDILDGPVPEYTEEQRAAFRAAFRVMVEDSVKELEAKFADRGLRFTEDFRGACPMQAFGWIDGQRFYFRYRGDFAALRVGTVDPVLAQKHYEYERTTKAKSMADFVAGHREVSEEEHQELVEQFASKAVLETNDDVHALPTAITALASKGNIQGHPYAGELNTKEEIVDTFSTLVERLEPYEVKEEKP